MSKRLELPFICFEIGERDTAIVLKNGHAGMEQHLPHFGEMPFVQEI